MSVSHRDSVQNQFSPQAEAYLHSAVHAQGPDLLQARDVIAALCPQPYALLDVGCGGGHLSFTLASLVARAVALDASPAMLSTVRAAAAERGLSNLGTVQGSATALPFADASFDVVASRYSAHHWTDLPAGLAEMVRVLRPGGHLLMIDTEGYDDPLVDTHFQAMELLRDPSHVRNRSPLEWDGLLRRYDLIVKDVQHWPLRLEFASWIARMRTSAARASAIRTLQQDAPAEVRAALAFEDDGSFTARTGLWWGQRPA